MVSLSNVNIMQLLNILEENCNVMDKIRGIQRFFISPEVTESSDNATDKSDVYSLGSILYMLITGGFHQNENSIAFETLREMID